MGGIGEPVSVTLPRNEWGWVVEQLREAAKRSRSVASKATTTPETQQWRLNSADNYERVAASIAEQANR